MRLLPRPTDPRTFDQDRHLDPGWAAGQPKNVWQYFQDPIHFKLVTAWNFWNHDEHWER